jgi:hypothetical protein
MLVDDRGNLWARHSPARRTPLWFVFENTGVLRHTLLWGHEVLDIRDQRVLALQYDSSSVPSVVVYRLSRRN